MTLRDTDGRQIARNDDGGVGFNSLLNYTATDTGTIYIDACSYLTRTGTYTVATEVISEPSPDPDTMLGDDHGNTPGTAGMIDVGEIQSGAIENGADRDWFAVEVTAGNSYSLDLRGAPTNDGTLRDTVMTVYDEAGNRLAFNDDGGVGFNSALQDTPTQTDTIYVEARSFASFTGTYELEVQQTNMMDDYCGHVFDMDAGGEMNPGAVEEIGHMGIVDFQIFGSEPVTTQIETPVSNIPQAGAPDMVSHYGITQWDFA